MGIGDRYFRTNRWISVSTRTVETVEPVEVVDAQWSSLQKLRAKR